MSRLMLSILLMATLGAPAPLAAASKPLTKPKSVAASIVGNVTAPVALACTSGTLYASTCPGSSGACTCVTLTGTASGGFGKGPVSGAITVDNFDATPESGCAPVFGSLAITNAKTKSKTTLDVTGALCNSTIPNGNATVGGGFDFDPATTGFTGTGSVAGTVTVLGAVNLKLAGAMAPVAVPTAATP
jgi:hypothetical protein